MTKIFKKTYLILIFSLLLSVFFSLLLTADTVNLKSGEKIKGLIVDDYKDRVTLSTVNGEITILKSDIRSTIYDTKEKELLKKAQNFQRRGKPIQAYYAYQEVLELNPDLDQARERLDYLRSFIETKLRKDLRTRLGMKNNLHNDFKIKNSTELLSEELGLMLSRGDKYIVVEDVKKRTRTIIEAGIKPGDKIVSIWRENVAYMDVDEVAGKLVEPKEIRLVIERDAEAELKNGQLFNGYTDIIDGKLKLTREGVVVDNAEEGGAFDSAGIREGDLLWMINGRETKYMPMDEIIDTIKDNRGKAIDIVIRRNIAFWKEKDRI